MTHASPELEPIFDLLGTPAPADVARLVRTEKAREHLQLYGMLPPVDLQARYRTAPPECIDLLRRMLAFFPEQRISVGDALKHPAFSCVEPPIRRDTMVVRCLLYDMTQLA